MIITKYLDHLFIYNEGKYVHFVFRLISSDFIKKAIFKSKSVSIDLATLKFSKQVGNLILYQSRNISTEKVEFIVNSEHKFFIMGKGPPL